MSYVEMVNNAMKTKVVKDYLLIDGKLTARWFPLVPGFPGQLVVPKEWVNAHCPNGFKRPEGAHHAARQFLEIES